MDLDLQEAIGVGNQLVFPSPDGELVGLDIVGLLEVSKQDPETFNPLFPSPDGELVGLDKFEKLRFIKRTLDRSFRPLTGNW